MNLVTLQIAEPMDREWAKQRLIEGHYLHTAPDPRTRAFCYIARLDGVRVGCLWFGRPESTCCYRGGLTYGSLDDVRSGRARFDRWEVLNLSRVWLDPCVQRGGPLYTPELLPGYVQRDGTWRSSLASTLIRMALARVGFEYLMGFPPCFIDQPYRIRAVLSYCDTRKHRGLIYRASGFQLARVNRDGIETYWTARVTGLSRIQDGAIRDLAAVHPRSVRIREKCIENALE